METDRESKSSKKYNVDTGFAWIVLIACFVEHLFVVGSIKAYGVLYTEMVEYYSSGSGNTAWIGGIARTLQFGLGPVANSLCRTYTFRRICFTGGLLIGLGYILSGLAPRMEYMYLTFLCAGIGYGLTFSPTLVIICYYFEKRRALANCVVVAGSGVGTMGISFLYTYLLENYSLKGTFWIIGAIFFNVCASACVYRQPRHLAEGQEDSTRAEPRTSGDFNNVAGGQSQEGKCDENAVGKCNKRPCKSLDLQFSLFKNVSFTLYAVSFMCCAFGYTASFIVIPASVKALGYTKTHVSLSVAITGGVEIVARILTGLLANLNIIQNKYLYAFSMLIGGAFSLIVPFFESFTLIAVYAAVTAAFSGSYICFMSLLTIDIVGLKKLSPALGLLTFSLSVAMLPSQPVVGWLYDLFGNWRSSFILLGCVYTLAGVIILLEPFVLKCCKIADRSSIQQGETVEIGEVASITSVCLTRAITDHTCCLPGASIQTKGDNLKI